MDQSQYIAPGQKPTPPGGGPEGDPRYARNALRSQGLLTVAFGFALGLTFVLIYFILKISFFPNQIGSLLPSLARTELLTAVYYFLFGFVIGTLISALYNLLVVKRLNLFGLEDYHN